MNPFLAVDENLVLDRLGSRILVIGNSGSGKSTLAAKIATRVGCQVTPLDSIYWIDQALLRKRGQADAIFAAREVAATPAWVVEGVFGWLADLAVPRATALIWMDLTWEVCREGLMARGPQYGEDAAEFAGLLVWAEAYWQRTTGSSYAGHARIFEAFAGTKIALTSRAGTNAVMPGLDRR